MSWLASDAVWLPSLVRRGKEVVVAENQPGHHTNGRPWLTGGSCWAGREPGGVSQPNPQFHVTSLFAANRKLRRARQQLPVNGCVA
jgi:hypothetical protein